MRKATKLLVASARRKNGQYARDNTRSGDTWNTNRYPMGEYGDWQMPRRGDMMVGERHSPYRGNDIGFSGDGRMDYGEHVHPHNDTEMRRRRDSRGRYAMAYDDERMEQDNGRSRMNAGGSRAGEQRMGKSERYEDDEDDDMEFDEYTANKWTKALENEDGSKGPHWSKEQTKLFMTQAGAQAEPVEFFAVMNAMYSDYCKVAKKYGVDKPDFYAELAKAWLDDKDAVDDKAAAYYRYVVKH